MTKKTELTTERLIVKTPDEKDVQDIFALMSDRSIAADTGFAPMSTASEAEGHIRRGMASQLMFGIVEKERPGRIIGVFELSPQKKSTASGEKCNYEICYFLHHDARGKGYMTEVVEAMKRYMFTERDADMLTIYVVPKNDASRRVTLKCGFTYDGLKKECGFNYRNELVDLEYYTLYKEEYMNPDTKLCREKARIVERQKWINEGGILYPIPGYATLLPAPGHGVFRIRRDRLTDRLGLEKIDESFTFDFKIYDLDCESIIARVIKTWTSGLFAETNKNLGVIFNGLKGTGKTIAAKLLSNRIGLPVIVISSPIDGLLEFIQSLCFECVILIDEAEKTFDDDQEVLLKMIDGVYNNARKLYILTTNKLDIDENLLGRPGRIRYIKEFGNLSVKAVSEIIDDNLNDMSLKEGVLKLADTLEISTIDVLKSIIEECNIMGEVPSELMMNIPVAKYKIQLIEFKHLTIDKHQALRDFIGSRLHTGETVADWLGKLSRKEKKTNKEVVEDMFKCDIETAYCDSVTPDVHRGQKFGYGRVIYSSSDKQGFFTCESAYDDSVQLCCMGDLSFRLPLYGGGPRF